MEQEKAREADQSPPSAPTTPTSHEASPPPKPSTWQRTLDIVFWVPPNCRWDPENPPAFTMSMNFLFALAGAFSVANLYYNHPILNILADDFAVPYAQISQIPTVMQAGYATGLLFLCPLADTLPRRPFITSLMFVTAAIWLGLTLTTSLPLFTALSYLVGATTVTPQLLLPLVGDLAPPSRKALHLALLTSGLQLGVLLARLLSGTLTQFSSWRHVYYLSLGLQLVPLALLLAFMPNYPRPPTPPLSYPRLLASLPRLPFTLPPLPPACTASLLASAAYTSFWTTLVFHLAGPPYRLSPLPISLFALVALPSLALSPLFARRVTDALTPWHGVVFGLSLALVGIFIGTFTPSLAGPVIQAFLLDLGYIAAQVANRTAVYAAVEPGARNRVNTVFMVAGFCGQLIGTAVGGRVWARGGWKAVGGLGVGFVVCALGSCVVRGPGEKGWWGWGGGWGLKKEEGEGDEEGRRTGEEVVEEDGRDGESARGEGDGDQVAGDGRGDGEKRRRSSEKSEVPEAEKS